MKLVWLEFNLVTWAEKEQCQSQLEVNEKNKLGVKRIVTNKNVEIDFPYKQHIVAACSLWNFTRIWIYFPCATSGPKSEEDNSQ